MMAVVSIMSSGTNTLRQHMDIGTFYHPTPNGRGAYAVTPARVKELSECSRLYTPTRCMMAVARTWKRFNRDLGLLHDVFHMFQADIVQHVTLVGLEGLRVENSQGDPGILTDAEEYEFSRMVW